MAIYSSHTDEDLMDLLRQNDQKAFREIYDRYWRQLFAHAVKKLNNNHEAEDLVQQLFVEIWERRANIRVTRSLSHWLAAAVRYKVLSLFSDRYRTVNAMAEISPEVPETAPLPHSLLELQQLLMKLENLVDTLPDRPRVIYRMSRETQMSNKEIAAALNLSEKTVKNHMNRALGSLRKSLGDSHFTLLFSLL